MLLKTIKLPKCKRLWMCVFLSVFSCKPRPPKPTETKAQPFARKIMGEATSFHPQEIDPKLISESIQERRKKAWLTVEEVLRPVSITMVDPAGEEPPRQIKIANFQTWYDAEEFQKMFRILYKCYLTKNE